jgi:hypothetical protein
MHEADWESGPAEGTLQAAPTPELRQFLSITLK